MQTAMMLPELMCVLRCTTNATIGAKRKYSNAKRTSRDENSSLYTSAAYKASVRSACGKSRIVRQEAKASRPKTGTYMHGLTKTFWSSLRQHKHILAILLFLSLLAVWAVLGWRDYAERPRRARLLQRHT